MKQLVVTGAAGFIGSAFCRYILANRLATITAIDCLTYAASARTLAELQALPGFTFHQLNILNKPAVAGVLKQASPDAIVHFAAESHVDRSIDDASDFVQTNVVGTVQLLEAARDYWRSLTATDKSAFRFLHISTDEVYGTLGTEGSFTEYSPYAPNSPYAASKAASDHFVRAWHETYGLPTLIGNCSNNYGPYQFPEKLIPTMITKALSGASLPVYGTGDNVRDWLYVDDHAEALWTILSRGQPGEKYLIGGDGERSNLALVKELCRLLDEKAPRPHGSYEQLITFVADRPGHDKRYAIDYSKIKRELGWQPRVMLPQGLARTVDWYLANKIWWQEIHAGSYGGERLGQALPPVSQVKAGRA